MTRGGFKGGLSLGRSDLEGLRTYMETVTGRCMPLERMGAVVTLMRGVSFPLPNCQGNNCANPQLSRGGLATSVPTIGNFLNEMWGLFS